MTIYTLYKNCILNNSYSEVFDTIHKDSNNKTAFDRYINTLTKFEGSIADSYGSASGSFSIELDFLTNGTKDNIYEYNYMLFNDTDNNFKRYCFIDSIEVVNGYVIVRYSEDIWHTYAKDMNIRKSLLTNSRKLQYGNWKIPFYVPPMEYEGNNALEIELLNKSSTLTYYVVCEFQQYNLTQSGEISNRDIFQVMIGHYENDTNYYIWNFLSQEQYNKILSLYINSSKVTYTDRNLYYEITNIKLIPAYLYDLSTDVENSFTISYKTNYLGGNYYITPITLKFEIGVLAQTQNDLDLIYSGTISNDFKNYEFGTLSNSVRIENNGKDIKYEIYQFIDSYNYQLFLNVQNKLIEITSDFVLELPISVQTADITQQQSIARELKTIKHSFELMNGIFEARNNISLNPVSSNSKALSTNVGEMGIGESYYISKTSVDSLSGTEKIANGITGLISANASVYTSNKSSRVTSSGKLNCFLGLVIKKINPDNSEEVNMAIDNIGYLCNEIVDNLLLNKFEDYNVMKYGFVNIYGKFPQNIMNGLKAILLNGFKIWYTENV